MGRLSVPQKAELEAVGAKVIPLLELDLPSGNVQLAPAKAGTVTSAALGEYQERVERFGTFRQSLDLETCSLYNWELSVDVDDTDLWFSNIVGAGYDLQGSEARLRIGSETETPATNWLLHATGQLYGYRKAGENLWSLLIRAPDTLIENTIPRRVITPYAFTDAPQESFGTPMQLVYGIASDVYSTNTGLVPCVHVDTVNNSYLVCDGWAYDVVDVYVDGTRQTSGFTVDYTTRGGRRCTLITFTVSKGSSQITANVLGYETVGDRSGSLITHPVDILQHILVNFAFNEATGNWLAVSEASVDSTSFAAAKTFLASRAGGAPYVGSWVISTKAKAVSLLERACASMHLPPYWSAAGEIALYVNNPHTPAAYVTDPLYSQDDGIRAFACEYDGREAANTVATTYGSDGTIDEVQEIQDVSAPIEAVKDLALDAAAPPSPD